VPEVVGKSEEINKYGALAMSSNNVYGALSFIASK